MTNVNNDSHPEPEKSHPPEKQVSTESGIFFTFAAPNNYMNDSEHFNCHFTC